MRGRNIRAHGDSAVPRWRAYTLGPMLRDRAGGRASGRVRGEELSARERRWLRTRIAVVVLLGAVVVGTGVALLLSNTLGLRQSADTTVRSDVYLLRVVDLERLVVDAETGLRGDVITGRSLFLQPLHEAQAELPGATREVEQSAAATGADKAQVRALVSAVNAYMSNYVPGAVALVRQSPAAARSLSVTLEGKREVDAIRKIAGDLEQMLSHSSADRQRDARSTATTSVDESIAVLVLLTLLTCVLGGYLGHLAVAREHAREQSDTTARTLQESILPPAMPEIPGCELAVRFQPGDGPVSGDFYDAFLLEPDTWALLIGDVCGKGARAAAATAMGRWTLRSSLSEGATPAEALRVLNDVMLAYPDDPRFITALCLTVTLTPDAAQVRIACAGHPAPILVPADGTPSAVATHGDLLGIFPDVRLEVTALTLRPGDSLVAYTDGVTDQGPEAIASPEQALREQPGTNADELASTLERLARRPFARHPDDVAVLALRFLGRAPAAPHATPTAAAAS
jgi:CHASE3 domain sensor protein